MTVLATAASEARLARPLNVLVPLIQDDLQQGRVAAERAGLPYYRAAGEKLNEAKSQLEHGEFRDWLKRHFAVSLETARIYMRFAEETVGQKPSALGFSSLSDFVRQTGNPNYNRPIAYADPPPAWHKPVQRVVDQVDTQRLNLRREEMKRAEEQDAQRTLALQLIDIGYRVLARKLHPDKGGSRDAMVRLNAVRDRLKRSV
jgi:hypothetical protein